MINEDLLFGIYCIDGVNIKYIYLVRGENDEILYAVSNADAAYKYITDNKLEKYNPNFPEEIILNDYSPTTRTYHPYRYNLYNIKLDMNTNNIIDIIESRLFSGAITDIITLKGLSDGYQIVTQKINKEENTVTIAVNVPRFEYYCIDQSMLAINLVKEYINKVETEFDESDSIAKCINKFNDMLIKDLIEYNKNI